MVQTGPATADQTEESMAVDRHRNPLFGPNRFKLGVFSANCDGGLTMSLAPERWKADWTDIVAMTRIADDAGLEFILPVAKWRGYQGKAKIYGRSFETLTHGAALGALTRNIAIFCTVHVPLVTPAFAAKAMATIDHVTNGRAGLNIVCGWNQEEFDLHGVTIDQDARYDHGLEWFRIWSKLLEGGPEFDWDGQFFHLKRLHTDPLTIQRPWPAVMSAGFSPKGRDFAAQAADVLFTNVTQLGQIPGVVGDIRDYMASRNRDISVFTMAHVVCRPTRREAEEFFHYFAEEMADEEGQNYYREKRGTTAGSGKTTVARPFDTRFHLATGKRYAGAYPGAFPLVGTPDDITAELVAMSEGGLAGSAIAFLDYLKEIPFFVQEVLPRLQRAGLRQPVSTG
ncbi:LLM class flavin-dependent oxidoreductase [Bradyrhizobium sp. LHD-71]|uniref:LLM class flavin-dependent oxidoreductase n=1 Tax=Bradyrhizobium sp. LHD-71 TaxID=3072141 RepID=UPI00280D2670|nr:LLM class flavin-dependent oxidoreductase [Bradyrhizobium sp. LHD-71]MDQ8732428.1 LLM class flavin-dependent oxidoreductase [Bradyrhizobium sp. LHD-71]